MKKKMITGGGDYTSLVPIFRDIVVKSGVRPQESVIFSGCPGPCYSMATFFGFGIRDLDLNLYFAVNAEINHLWRMEYVEKLGVLATERAAPLKAKAIVLMSGLTRMPLEKTLSLIQEALDQNGVIIGETVDPGLFEKEGWDKQIPFNFLLEFSMYNPSTYEIVSH